MKKLSEKLFGFFVENELQSLYLLAPILFGIGCAVYFSLHNEPSFNYSALAFALSAAITIICLKVKRSFLPALFISFLIAGFFFANLRAKQIDDVVIEKLDGPVWVRADIKKLERKDKEARLVVDNIDLWQPEVQNFQPELTPKKARVTVRTKIDSDIRIGDRVAFKAMLTPPSERPVFPGGYDFNRLSYFQHIGAIGYAISPVELYEEKKMGFVDRLQDYIYTKINNDIPDKDIAAIIVAQITADRVEISDDLRDKVKAAGLSHLLAISGLNMSIAMVWLFFLSRSFMAFFPRLALQHDIKKLSVFIAVAFGFLYLLVTGMPVSAVRAFLMVLLFFIAVLIDRSSISLHPVAFAALAILIFRPENIINPGFQLSFAAVIALIGFYEMYEKYFKRERKTDLGIITRFLMVLVAVASSTFFTSLTTAPFAIMHFGTFQNYGIISNMICVPVVELITLPFSFLAVLMMPLGLEKPFLYVASWGAETLRTLSYYIGSKPSAVTYMADTPNGFIAYIVIGFLILFIFKTKIRWAGIPLILFGYYLLLQKPETPDFVINETGSLIALKQDDGGYKYFGINRDSFAQYQFNSKLGVANPEFIKSSETCNRKKCVYKNMIFGNTLDKSDCDGHDYLINLGKTPITCDKTAVIDKTTLKDKGTHLFYLDKGQILSASDSVSDRIWNKR